MARGFGGPCVSLPPIPTARQRTPEERAASAAEWEALAGALVEQHESRRKEWERRIANPEALARIRAQRQCSELRCLLRKAAQKRTYARAAWLLEEPPHITAWIAKEAADRFCANVERRTRSVYLRAADGCEVCAAFLADAGLDALYAEAFATD